MKRLLFILFIVTFIFSCQEEKKVIDSEVSEMRTIAEFKNDVQRLKEQYGGDNYPRNSLLENSNVKSEYVDYIEKDEIYDVDEIYDGDEVKDDLLDVKLVNIPIDEPDFSHNSLYTGATPYSYCYGSNPYCSPPSGYVECSGIKVKSSYNSDVLVLIKKNDRVYSHAYIKAGGSYMFKLKDGTYQPFFYYGKGWNPNKYLNTIYCGKVMGGFVSDELLSKDDPQYLNHSTLTYTLRPANGNFSTQRSNKGEAFK